MYFGTQSHNPLICICWNPKGNWKSWQKKYLIYGHVLSLHMWQQVCRNQCSFWRHKSLRETSSLFLTNFSSKKCHISIPRNDDKNNEMARRRKLWDGRLLEWIEWKKERRENGKVRTCVMLGFVPLHHIWGRWGGCLEYGKWVWVYYISWEGAQVSPLSKLFSLEYVWLHHQIQTTKYTSIPLPLPLILQEMRSTGPPKKLTIYYTRISISIYSLVPSLFQIIFSRIIFFSSSDLLITIACDFWSPNERERELEWKWEYMSLCMSQSFFVKCFDHTVLEMCNWFS